MLSFRFSDRLATSRLSPYLRWGESAHAKYGQKFNLLSHMKVFQRNSYKILTKSDGVNFLII